jgi:hypothetical protein
VSNFHIRKVEVDGNLGKGWKDAVIAFANLAIGKVSFELPSHSITLSAGTPAALAPADILKSQYIVKTSGTAIDLGFRAGAGAVLIDKAAVRALATLAPPQPTSQARLLPPASGANDDFAIYRGAFLERAASVDAEITADSGLWSGTAVAVPRKSLASAWNSRFRNATLCADVTLPPIVDQQFQQPLRTDPEPSLNCSQYAARSCDIQMECSQTRSCDPSWGCESCSWWDALCDGRRLGCEASKTGYRLQCETEKEAARLGCEADKTYKRVACESEKAAEIAGCQLKQGWLHLWSDLDLGEVTGSASVGNITGTVCLANATFDDSLTALRLDATVAAQANVVASFTYQPLNIGYLVCVCQWGGHLDVTVGAPPQQIGLTGALTLTSSSPDVVAASFSLVPDNGVTLTMTPPPILLIPSQIPQVYLVCPASGATELLGLTINAKIREDLISPRLPISLPLMTGVSMLGTSRISVGSDTISLVPSVTSTTIRWIAQ